MAEIDVAVSLIQLIGLFLPAWAVMVQILARVMSNETVENNPRAIPFIAAAFTAAFMSLFQFAWAAVLVIDFLRTDGFLGQSAQLASATEFIAFGGLAFFFLGLMVLAQSTLDTYGTDDAMHILLVTMLFSMGIALAWVGARWETVPMAARPLRLMVVVVLIWLGDLLYIQRTDPRIGKKEEPERGFQEKQD